MPPNSFVLNQTCIFPHPLTWCTPGKERNTMRNCLVLLLNFKKILELLAKDITQYLLTYLAQCFILDRSRECMCVSSPSLLDSLFVCELLYVCLHMLSSFFLSYRWEWELKKKRQQWDFTWESRGRACWAATMQFHCRVATFRPIHPSLLSPIREDGQVNKCTRKTSSSRRYGSTSQPPQTLLLHPHTQSTVLLSQM